MELSHTSLQRYRECPYRFLLAGALGLRRPDPVEAEFTGADHGTLAHAAMQRWLEPGSYLGRPEKRRTVKPRELPRDFVAKARADGPARRSGEPQVVDEETEKRYLRLLGASR